MEEWKTIICDSDKCMSEMFVPENMKASDNSLNDEAIELYKISPEIDNEDLQQCQAGTKRCKRSNIHASSRCAKRHTAQSFSDRTLISRKYTTSSSP